MTDKKLTDNEIIKACECCMKICEDCENCPCINNNDYTSVWDCKDVLSKSILDLFNRQEIKIDRLEHQLETFCITLKLAKAEVIKEFATTLQNRCKKQYGIVYLTDIEIELNKFLKGCEGK